MIRVAFISDIHGNIDAFQSVLARIDQVGVDMTLCLGDIVGYGPAPAECIALIREREIPTVLGNHDEYVTLIDDPHVKALRPEIQQAIEWTQMHLSMDDLKWLSQLPRVIDAESFAMIHSSFSAKSRWAYCVDEHTFMDNFKHQTYELAFCGHSHQPLIGYDQTPELPMVDFIRDVTLPTEGKIMVNVGSVGQPRDRNPKSCVVFYEVENRHLWLERVEYDLKSAYKRFAQAKLPPRFGDRIMLGK